MKARGPLTLALLLVALGALAACTGGASAPTVPILSTSAPETARDATPTPAARAADSPETLDSVPNAPARDTFDLARRLRGVDAAPLPLRILYADAAPGSLRSFTGINLTRNTLFEFPTEARHVSASAVWRFPPDSGVPQERILAAAREFEERILPGVLQLIAPGLALPGRIAVVHGHFAGAGGYFNSADALPRAAYPASNERVALFINLDAGVGNDYHYAVLAHELQHLVHWMLDPIEEAWVQEGLSELAARSLGYEAIPYSPYLQQPEVSLDDWPAHPQDALPNYAGASLFAAYLVDRLGPDLPARLAAQPLDGAAGVEAAAPEFPFVELYVDWLTANVVAAPSPPYGYDSLDSRAVVRRIVTEPGRVEVAALQSAPAYIELQPSAPWNVTLTPRPTTPLLPVQPYSGGTCWWSNRGEAIDATLTREVDLTGADSPALEFQTWWEIEEHWDHAYVTASADGGATWSVLRGALSSTRDPLQTAFGPSYTGSSGGWRREQIDLSPFAGREILLRFEYVTDDAVNGAGWCIDDIAIPDAGFFDDAESDAGWTSAGFVRAGGHSVAQEFAVRLAQGAGGDAVVVPLPPGAGGRRHFSIDAPATLIVVPFAPKTTQPAVFTVEAEAGQ